MLWLQALLLEIADVKSESLEQSPKHELPLAFDADLHESLATTIVAHDDRDLPVTLLGAVDLGNDLADGQCAPTHLESFAASLVFTPRHHIPPAALRPSSIRRPS